MILPKISKILISSSDVILDPKQSHKSNSLSLQKNQVVEAKVLKKMDSSLTELSMLGKRVIAKTYVPLKEGDQIQLQNASSDTKNVFKLISQTQSNTTESTTLWLKQGVCLRPYETLLSLFEKFNSAGQVSSPKLKAALLGIERLQTLLRKLALDSPIPDSSYVKRLIEGSGLLWENKLNQMIGNIGKFDTVTQKEWVNNDIKAQLLQMLNEVHDVEDQDISLIQEALESLEKYQVVTKYQSDSTRRFLFPLPFLSMNQIQLGQLFIDLGKQPNEDTPRTERMVRIAFLLEMSELGKIRANFSLLKKQIQGYFEVTSSEIATYIQESLTMLNSRLEQQGFHPTRIECQIVDDEILANASFVDELIDNPMGVLNVLI
ncbi:MAG: flagellar hook-length control protein FliK [Desulfobacterales bacterium]|nr:flagellar hook-length control protein FliK [Desulfobacterales bacterium]